MKNEFCWAQLHTSQVEDSKKFYQNLFNWEYTEVEYPLFQYIEINAGNGHCGGIFQATSDEPAFWFPFVKVADINESTYKAIELGGQVLMEPTLTPETEFFSVIMDPSGAIIGLHQEAPEDCEVL